MSLIINLGKVRVAEGTTSTFELIENNFNFLDDHLALEKPLKISFMATNLGITIELKGHIETVLKAQCDRCLKDVSIPINIILNEELIFFNDGHKLEDFSKDEIEERYFSYDNDLFDISDLVRENITTSLPLKMLCSEECKGLCTKCGKDLNIEICNCEDYEIDPRLAVLAKLKGNEEV